GFIRVHFDEGLRQMIGQTRCSTGPSHGVPLITDTTGVKYQRKFVIRRVGRGAGWSRHQPGPGIRMKEPSIMEQPRGAVPSSQDWPLAWAQAVVSVGIETRQPTNMKSPLYTVLIVAPGGQACVLIEYLVWALVVESLEPESASHFTYRPPVGLCRSRRRQKGLLPGQAAFRIGYRTVF